MCLKNFDEFLCSKSGTWLYFGVLFGTLSHLFVSHLLYFVFFVVLSYCGSSSFSVFVVLLTLCSSVFFSVVLCCILEDSLWYSCSSFLSCLDLHVVVVVIMALRSKSWYFCVVF